MVNFGTIPGLSTALPPFVREPGIPRAAAFLHAGLGPGEAPREIFSLDDAELRALAMASGRRKRMVTEPLQVDDAIARSKLCITGGGPHVTVEANAKPATNRQAATG